MAIASVPGERPGQHPQRSNDKHKGNGSTVDSMLHYLAAVVMSAPPLTLRSRTDPVGSCGHNSILYCRGIQMHRRAIPLERWRCRRSAITKLYSQRPLIVRQFLTKIEDRLRRARPVDTQRSDRRAEPICARLGTNQVACAKSRHCNWERSAE